MFPYPLGVLTLLQGLYTLLSIICLMDVLSPTLDLRDVARWSLPQTFLVSAVLLSTSFAVGVAMHTVSRNLFRKAKDEWDARIVLSPGVKQRLDTNECGRPAGGPSLEEVHAREGLERVRTAGEFMHALDYVLQLRAPDLHQAIQVYRDQYRLARGFVLPSLMLAIVVPFWEPVPSGHLGSFPLIGFQVFFLGVFFAGACMYAFRERSHRYTAARLRSFWTLEAEAQQTSRPSAAQLAAVR